VTVPRSEREATAKSAIDRSPRRLTLAPNGNQNAVRHRVYSKEFTPEELTERTRYEGELFQDLGSNPTTAQKTLVRRAGYIEIKLMRTERATAEGTGEIANEHVLAWINAQRLLLCALELERKARPAMDLKSYLERKKTEVAP
jgi:hypothetical protein